MTLKKQYSLNKTKRNTYDFHENTFSDNDIKIKKNKEKDTINDIKKDNNKTNNTSEKYKENKSSNDFVDDLVDLAVKNTELLDNRFHLDYSQGKNHIDLV